MKKSLLLLLLVILLPSLVLGWLALRGAEEQQLVLERRTIELYQKEADTLAIAARTFIGAKQRAFADSVQDLLRHQPPETLAAHFTMKLRATWSQPSLGFALGQGGQILSPSSQVAQSEPQANRFITANSGFLNGTTPAAAYPVTQEALTPNTVINNGNSNFQTQGARQNGSGLSLQMRNGPPEPARILGQELPSFGQSQRNVSPQNSVANAQSSGPSSQFAWAMADFPRLVATGNEGVVNRFLQDELNMLFWVRPAQAPQLIFGCLLRPADLRDQWPGVVADAVPTEGREFFLALLDDKAEPVVVSPPGFAPPNWKKPFVATEIGDALPHWEAALYFRDPASQANSGRQMRRQLILLIVLALAAIAYGGWAVFANTRRELALAQQKTDFVSNVSHELKTPLTSIRMFAEMMHAGRAAPERIPEYLRIMVAESERLTRLINIVLDFARLERREQPFDKRPFDLYATLENLWPSQEVPLREAGFTVCWEREAAAYPMLGDEEAISRVIVNLLSNAEKYGGERKEVTLRSYLEGCWICVSVLDRGAGVPAGQEAKVFEPFYRAHDSLTSGIPGSGLGLALALRIVRAHGGEITYQPRPDGGSNFTMRLPMHPAPAPLA